MILGTGFRVRKPERSSSHPCRVLWRRKVESKLSRAQGSYRVCFHRLRPDRHQLSRPRQKILGHDQSQGPELGQAISPRDLLSQPHPAGRSRGIARAARRRAFVAAQRHHHWDRAGERIHLRRGISPKILATEESPGEAFSPRILPFRQGTR